MFAMVPTRPKVYSLLNTTVRLRQDPLVFSPSSHGLAFAKILKVRPNETCLDVGCGCGIFAIAAAKSGAIVTAIDPNASALRLTRENAELNKVSVRRVQGRYFGKLRGTFDVIIANLPQDIVHADCLHTLSWQQRISVDGGRYGNNIICKFLSKAGKHMHSHSRLYTLVYTGTAFRETQAYIKKNFRIIECHKSIVPCKSYMAEHSNYYTKLAQQGTIDIFRKRGSWYAYQYEYVLQKKIMH